MTTTRGRLPEAFRIWRQDQEEFFLASSPNRAAVPCGRQADCMGMNRSFGPLLTTLHWHETGELSDEDREAVISALAQAHGQSVVDLNHLLQKVSLPSAC